MTRMPKTPDEWVRDSWSWLTQFGGGGQLFVRPASDRLRLAACVYSRGSTLEAVREALSSRGFVEVPVLGGDLPDVLAARIRDAIRRADVEDTWACYTRAALERAQEADPVRACRILAKAASYMRRRGVWSAERRDLFNAAAKRAVSTLAGRN